MNETPVITRRQAVDAFGGSVTKLARALDVSRSAVYLWPEDEPIPELQALRLRFLIKPEVFAPGASGRAA